MKDDIIDFPLPSDIPEGPPRECRMSLELYQNARQTMGEIRDFLRESGMSWDFIQSQIERSKTPGTPLGRALQRLDDYSTGPGRSLQDKESNVW